MSDSRKHEPEEGVEKPIESADEVSAEDHDDRDGSPHVPEEAPDSASSVVDESPVSGGSAPEPDVAAEEHMHDADPQDSVGSERHSSTSAPLDDHPAEPGIAAASSHEPAHEHEDEHSGPTMAGRVLRFLVVLLIGFGLALWAAPKIAPHLPASVAPYLIPAVDLANREVDALRNELAAERSSSAARIAALTGRIEDLSAAQTALGESGSAADTAAAEALTALATELTALGERVDAIGPRIAGVESAASGVASELAELQNQLSILGSGATTEDGSSSATSPELAAAVASIATRVDALSGRIDSLAEQSALDAFAARLDAAEKALTDATAEQAAAATAAETAARRAELTRAATALQRGLLTGGPFSESLGEVEEMTGTAAPDELRAVAGSGVVLPNTLRTEFGARATEAISASIAAEADSSGLFGDTQAWLRSRVTGRPVTEQEGDDVPSILSRVEARIGEGDLAAALIEAETLPQPAQDALGDWLERLRARVAAEKALTEYLGAIGASG